MIIRKAAGFLLLLCVLPALAQTQNTMNAQACAAYRQADERLNVVYRKILHDHKGDAVFIAKLKKAQRAWLAFRDAELGAVYPASDKQAEYGSVYPLCHCAEQTKLVQQRIEQLSGWHTAQEGDACRGSR